VGGHVEAGAWWGGRVIFDVGSLLFVGPGGLAELHTHHAVQLIWAQEGEFTVTLEQPMQRRAVLIPAGVPHSIAAVGRRVAILLVEPHGTRGDLLDRRARSLAGAEVVTDLEAIAFPSLDLELSEAAAWRDTVLAKLGADEPAVAISSISRRAIAYVESAIDGKPELGEAARRIGISPTRLTHVFSREVRIPFRRFVLWERMKRAAAAVQAGDDLTRAAVAAGFSDSPHLSRTFRGMFGLSPSLVLQFIELVGSLSAEA
jgi:AraC-like DNA-binding protein